MDLVTTLATSSYFKPDLPYRTAAFQYWVVSNHQSRKPYKKAGFLSEGFFSALPAFNMVQRDRFMRQEQEMERMSPSPTECERIRIVVTAY
jgi:hypothetical protein